MCPSLWPILLIFLNNSDSSCLQNTKPALEPLEDAQGCMEIY